MTNEDAALQGWAALRPQALAALQTFRPDLLFEGELMAAGRNYAELLKCLQQLMNTIYPEQALHQQQEQRSQQSEQQGQEQQQEQQLDGHKQQQAQEQQDLLPPEAVRLQHGEAQGDEPAAEGSSLPPEGAAAGKGLSPGQAAVEQGCSATSSADAGTASSTRSKCSPGPLLFDAWPAAAVERQQQVRASLLLYFACVPAVPVYPELVKQLKAAAADGQLPFGSYSPPSSSSSSSSSSSIGGNAMAVALLGVRSVLGGAWPVFLRCCQHEGALLLRLVMQAAVTRARLGVMTAVATSFRQLPLPALQSWLQLADDAAGEEQLVALLQAAKSSGCAAAGVAMERAGLEQQAAPSPGGRAAAAGAASRELLAGSPGESGGTSGPSCLPRMLFFRR